ncbi:MAG: nitrate- and nitrite sensing domain-containing protein [candidate division Zixibacteria bacterium]|nr:nitrate- and nitrite sensing domain-containing protein [candidate division Zixibacteria bacterium]
MSFLKNLSIRNKLFAMVAIPLICMLFLSVNEVIRKTSIANEMEQLEVLAEYGQHVSKLIHETQKERGATSVFLNSKGKTFGRELAAQRKLTDENSVALTNWVDKHNIQGFGPTFMSTHSQAMTKLKSLSQIRKRVDNHGISPKEAISIYTSTNTTFLDAVQNIIALVKNKDISQETFAYHSFLMSKERAGIERAVVSGTFGARAFTEGNFEKLIKLITEQNTYLSEFVQYATPEVSPFYNSKISVNAIKEVEHLRQIALDKHLEGNFGIDAGDCFNKYTLKINILKEIDDYLAQTLVKHAEKLHSVASTEQITFIIIGVVVLALTIWLVLVISGAIAIPIAKISAIAEDISYGKIDHEIEITSSDEIGKLASSFTRLIDYFKDLTSAAQKISQNDLRIEFTARSEHDTLGKSFQLMVTNLTGIFNTLSTSVSSVVSAATEISSTATEMSRGADDQSNRIEQISAAVEEMAATIIQSANNAGEASGFSQDAAKTAAEGGEIVGQTITGMKEIGTEVTHSAESIKVLASSADKIGEIISVIDDIADQTNLLALNAAIEAARAGEQGRGFAVVADEVRKLADRTGKATNEISSMISGMQEETQAAVTAMENGVEKVEYGRAKADKAGESLGNIVRMSQSVLDMIKQIATATDQQSMAAEEISKRIEDINKVTKETAEGAKQSAEAAEDLNKQAENLSEIVSQFNVN